ncbi:dTDP-4-dehydrorhamnose reductase [Bradyrhizobium sp. U87765 SZCCT0131]|uniref:dTDP-4-dehydrorhamnose reductase n=1 Tax=unclassified Bradyrhizobium TaxID=2631580 RepID=UPI001BAA9FA9|nr:MULTISPECIES: dTDP-4-dehydrorhamnose reductase [unclassified Bradyrhizobium]MBR1219677.1 dTDP-4-dehydrorhamnose reductase [Bradyrhizobium sp. U87765 SZCCT0131]MBR1262328.1 dTDP-4-dehydrorhamnose reductase [Bradyrhizobium sp. U87765 SZCCT0134]MBR1308489.1 dTDP-4-dehydrorhamnose reductase [Bradyrhizobium sp. U87765 SZCCT0110]MBR1318110.1 dTDP-4-dehydrorhamnose reductase [Bradyrhizobium sp. U87765 SZCCT0109]MBR1351813.1 dTDP-4-dehydrorhamnose reductase [Bradyrhizobium sp. U87765 SZCCT0048]
MNVLIFGRNGQVGTELQRALQPLGAITAAGRSDVDFADPAALRAFLATRAPDAIVNAAAYAHVDKAEDEPELARTVNVDSVGVLAEYARARGIWLVHYSTDYVFDGVSTRPYTETDATNPLGVYGRTKRDGELAIAASGCHHLIFRTSWLHAPHGANFIATILKLARTRDKLRVVADQLGAPTGADLVADVTALALKQALAKDTPSGIYHLTCTGATSWYGYARYLLQIAGASGVRLACPPDAVDPVTSAEYAARAVRPHNSQMDTTRLVRQFDVTLPDWRPGVERTVRALIEKAT